MIEDKTFSNKPVVILISKGDVATAINEEEFAKKIGAKIFEEVREKNLIFRFVFEYFF
jgi:hypothetical protein